MIRIFAADLEEELPPPAVQPAKAKSPAAPPEVPLADDEIVPAGEADAQIPQPQEPPIPPSGYEEMFPATSTTGQPLAPEQPEPQPEPLAPEAPVPEEPETEEAPPAPEDEFEEVTEELSELDKMNYSLSIPQKIEASLSEGYPLRIIYTTLKGHTTERTIRPDYFLPAKTTGNMVLIAWCELRNDWRGFIVNRIRGAKLEQKVNE